MSVALKTVCKCFLLEMLKCIFLFCLLRLLKGFWMSRDGRETFDFVASVIFFFLKFFDSLKVDSFANISCDASCSQEKLLRLPLHRWKMCYQRCPPPPITPVLLLQVSILIQQRVTQSQRSIFSHSATRSSIPTAVFLMSTSSCPSRITTTRAFS